MTDLDTISSYLGQPTSDMLSDYPFSTWQLERHQDEDVDDIIDYMFPNDGLDMLSDRFDHVATIFIYFDTDRRFLYGLAEVRFRLDREAVLAKFGRPSKSGNRMIDPILGAYGGWDRFSMKTYTLHIEYKAEDERISKVTLMRPDMVP